MSEGRLMQSKIAAIWRRRDAYWWPRLKQDLTTAWNHFVYPPQDGFGMALEFDTIDTDALVREAYRAIERDPPLPRRKVVNSYCAYCGKAMYDPFQPHAAGCTEVQRIAEPEIAQEITMFANRRKKRRANVPH